MEQPRAIVLGTGVIGRVHIDALRRNNVDIVSVVASSEARSIAAAADFGVPRGDPDVATALRATSPDVVHVCTPDTYHLEHAGMALDAGAHVVCEKPLTTDAGSAGELYRRAADSGRVHAICFNNRFYTLVQELAARRRLGTLDRVMLVRASVADDTFWLETDWDWRLLPEMGGPTIVTSTTGSHLLDLTSFLIGSRVVAVCADFLTAHDIRKRPRPDGGMDDYHAPGEDVSNLLVHWENGARGVLSLSHVAVGHPYRIRVEIDATAMGVSWDSERPNELWLGHRTEPNEIVLPDPRQATEEGGRFMDNPGAYREGFGDTFRLLFREVYRAVADGGQPDAPTFPTFQDGYGIQIVHDAALQSFQERRWVDVDWSAFDGN
ncbi:MAG: Gfo/Idh/MocA family oxidoreductase [Chloroflexi bacterium]|nr:Gfo/Idh/MocA family oxidoreductase [Chloroflexota bacterium]